MNQRQRQLGCTRRAANIVAAALSLIVSHACVAQAGDDVFTLILRDLSRREVRVAEINDRAVVHLEPSGWTTVKTEECLALVRAGDESRRPSHSSSDGVLMLSDGQRLPGRVVSAPDPAADAVAWEHPEFGRLEVPLTSVAWVTLVPDAAPPPQGDADIVLLANGDTVKGFVASLGDPVRIEHGEGAQHRLLEVPLARVAAVTMVSTPRKAAGRRLWLADGTVIDVSSLAAGDDGFVHFRSMVAERSGASRRDASGVGAESTGELVTRLRDVRAVLLDPAGAMPLSALSASRVEGPVTRYRAPQPRMLDAAPPLDVSRVELRGPLVARYMLPKGAHRLAVDAVLPPDASDWGDYEVIVRGDARELARERVNKDRPRVAINVPLSGPELTIEMTRGANGSIQDVLVLEMGLIAIDPNAAPR